MDAPSKLLILMMLMALVLGAVIVRFSPEYNQSKILQSNNENNYYTNIK